jgi:enediyne biosynthesis protein E4
MNVGIADLNWDNHPDIYISNIVSMVKDDKYVLPAAETVQHAKPEALARMRVVESNTLYVSKMRDGKLSYLVSAAVGRGRTSTGWAWDADFFDYDNDGDDDIYCLNGTNDYYIFAEARYRLQGSEVRSYPYSYARESKVLFRNERDQFVNASEGSGADFVGNSRAAAYLDFDSDGDLDIAINNFHEPARFLRNNAERAGHHWLKVLLQGDPARGSTRDAIGARVVAGMPDGGRLWREVHGGSGYLSMDPKEQHFGLGRNERADLWIVWPNGEEQFVRDLPADRAYRIVQGHPEAETLIRAGLNP